MTKKQSIGNTVDTKKVASLLVSQQDGAVASYPMWCFSSSKWKKKSIGNTADTREERCWWVTKMRLSPSTSYSFFQQMKKTQHRKYSWRKTGCMAVSESSRCRLLPHVIDGAVASYPIGSTRWCCRLLPHVFVLSTNEKSKAWKNTADTRQVASLLVSQQNGAVAS